ncbi:hypothetical protein [Paracidovorax wautersii]|uniref:Uncharacterized protein n=1 Tax=Paracidovorax wautersii TaxID=1177982 RepID=A0ABU1IG38_9BURK|nr:hypothetical protein [Paracidovorax wautersii]MDR6216162.1 hypothetical protein [Paracidovorax wautersii]
MSQAFLSQSIAVIDSAGQHRSVEVWTTPIQHKALPSSVKIINGTDEFFVDGQSVNKLKDGTYQVVQTDEILTPLPEQGDD